MGYTGHLHYVRLPQPPQAPLLRDWKNRPLLFVALDDDRYAKIQKLANYAGLSVRKYVYERLKQYDFKPIWEEKPGAVPAQNDKS